MKMKMENGVGLSEMELKRQRLLLMLPVLVIPFAAFLFWSLGGGKGKNRAPHETVTVSGLNASLPEVDKKQQNQDKLGFYAEAERDSSRYRELMKRDPYFGKAYGDYTDDLLPYEPFDDQGFAGDYRNPNEKKIYDRINALNESLYQAQLAESFNESNATVSGYDPQTIALREDINRLESMMQTMQGGGMAEDPELAEINSVLENVLDIQYPERVQERIRQNSEMKRGQVFAIAPVKSRLPITNLEQSNVTVTVIDSLGNNAERNTHAFYGLMEPTNEPFSQQAIEAVIHETQTLVSGSTVKLRLINDVYVNGMLIPRGEFLFGTASLRGERLEVNIESIRYGSNLFPVSLTVYDMDGLAGIHIPGSITRDAVKQNGDQALSGIGGMGMFNPSLGAQAASAGIDIGRNLLSRKIKLVKVEVKAGYKVLLKDNKNKN